LPWEETDQFIRSGHRDPDDFQAGTLRTITLSAEQGIKAIVGRPEGKETAEIQSYLFAKDKGWTMDKAKAWFDQHRERRMNILVPVKEKLLGEPKRVSGILALPGWSRNQRLWLPEEIEQLQAAFAGAPIYYEHINSRNVVGKNEIAAFDPELGLLAFEGAIFDEDTADKIEKGMIKFVSLGVDYTRLDQVNGVIPRGPYHDGEISLVAVPGVQGTSIGIAEKISQGEGGKAMENATETTTAPPADAKTTENLPITPAQMAQKPEVSSLGERVWTRAYVNDLPDDAFAIILPGGEKDEGGRAVPRNLRKFPHHDAGGKVDLPHLRNANARVPQSDLTDEQKAAASRHLDAHKRELGIGAAGEEGAHEHDDLIHSVEHALDEIYTIIDKQAGKVEERAPAQSQAIESERPQGVVDPEAAKREPERPSGVVDKRRIRALLPDRMQMRALPFGAQKTLRAIEAEVRE